MWSIRIFIMYIMLKNNGIVRMSKHAHKGTNDWSIILLNLHNNKKFRFTKGDWVEA